ncbi:MAG: hypothetical protein IKP49_07945 [Treponema sp.]|nr:hypothetical protein [Treponema sp.]
MTDVENIEKIIHDVFKVEKKIKNKENTNRCISPVNNSIKNYFAYNFLNRLLRLQKRFADSPSEINEICEKVKNIGESKEHQWAGPYSELVALDFYSQFSEFFDISYINQLPIPLHKDSIPARNGQRGVIDIDLCLHLRDGMIFTDVKSFNCVHLQIFDAIFADIEEFASKIGKSVLVGVDNLSEIDYREVKNHLGTEKNKIRRELKKAVSENEKNLIYESDGLKFNFKINYSSQKSSFLSTVKEYSPFAMAESYKFKFLDYGNKLVDNEYSMITIVRNPWFNEETVDFGDFNNFFYRSLSRRTFMELLKIEGNASDFSKAYSAASGISVSEVSKSLAGIVFIDDNSSSSKSQKNLYSAYIYLNPNYAVKNPLTIRKLEKYFRNSFEKQIKDFDDFKFDNY